MNIYFGLTGLQVSEGLADPYQAQLSLTPSPVGCVQVCPTRLSLFLGLLLIEVNFSLGADESR